MGCFRARLGGDTPISIMLGLEPIMDGPSSSIHGPELASAKRAAQKGTDGVRGRPCHVRRQDRFGSSTAIAQLPITRLPFLDGFNVVS